MLKEMYENFENEIMFVSDKGALVVPAETLEQESGKFWAEIESFAKTFAGYEEFVN